MVSKPATEGCAIRVVAPILAALNSKPSDGLEPSTPSL